RSHEVVQLRGHEARGRAGDHPMYADGDRLAELLLRAGQAARAQRGHRLLLLAAAGFALAALAVVVIEADLTAQADVVAAPPASQRRGIVAADAGERVPLPVLGRNEAIMVALEIEQAIAEDARLLHLVAEAFGHDAEILADDDRA